MREGGPQEVRPIHKSLKRNMKKGGTPARQKRLASDDSISSIASEPLDNLGLLRLGIQPTRARHADGGKKRNTDLSRILPLHSLLPIARGRFRSKDLGKSKSSEKEEVEAGGKRVSLKNFDVREKLADRLLAVKNWGRHEEEARGGEDSRGSLRPDDTP